MPKSPISNNLRISLFNLRKQGFSYKEIASLKGISPATAFRYSKEVVLDQKARARLILRRFPSKNKSIAEWELARSHAKENILPLIKQENWALIFACLHWCEGSKSELSFINSDPSMVKIYLMGLQSIGIPLTQIRFTLRSYFGHDDSKLMAFWATYLGINTESIGTVHHIEGKKHGKLKYGMCRVRVSKGSYYFKVVMSMIELVRQIQSLP